MILVPTDALVRTLSETQTALLSFIVSKTLKKKLEKNSSFLLFVQVII